jgi:hypothetical protein
LVGHSQQRLPLPPQYEFFSFSGRTATAVLAAQRSGIGAVQQEELEDTSPRLHQFLRGGVLYVHIDRAANLAAGGNLGGFTANM